MSDSTALDSFLDKWRTRWPEWALAEVFVPAAQRRTVVAWFALVQEFDDILNTPGDSLPADAKLAWWGEELRDWAGRRSRHPLGRMLEPLSAPWSELAAALPALPAARVAVADAEAALAGLRTYASALAAVERALFGGERGQGDQVILRQVLAQRLAECGIAAVPQVLRSGSDAQAQREWSGVLRRGWPGRTGTLPRRVWSALARARRANPQVGSPRPPPALATVWRAWNAARG